MDYSVRTTACIVLCARSNLTSVVRLVHEPVHRWYVDVFAPPVLTLIFRTVRPSYSHEEPDLYLPRNPLSATQTIVNIGHWLEHIGSYFFVSAV